ncbi:MAG: cytidylate kinase-like family protein [Gemmatimonadota bacterium]
MIITISRQYGAGGSRVAEGVAEALGWRRIDNELVDQVALRLGLPPQQVAAREERSPGFLDRLIRMLVSAAPEILKAPSDDLPELDEAKQVKVTEAVVEDLAKGGKVVMVGRAASAVLSTDRDALHVKVVAPKAFRVAETMRRLTLNPRDAEAEVESSDANRRRYHYQHYGRDWNDATHYHLVLNTGLLGIDGATAAIVARAKAMWP